MSKIEMDSFKNETNKIFFTRNILHLNTENTEDIYLAVGTKRLCYYLAPDPLFPTDITKKIFAFTTIQPGETNSQGISSFPLSITIIE